MSGRTVQVGLDAVHAIETEITNAQLLTRALHLAIDGQKTTLLSDADARQAVGWLAFVVNESVTKLAGLIDNMAGGDSRVGQGTSEEGMRT